MIKELTMEKPHLPVGWEMKTLGDLSEVITKGTTPTSVGHKFVSEGINFIKVESISLSGNFISKKFGHITQEGHNALKRSQLKNGDILFSIAGALGRTAIVNDEILPANTNQALAIIRLKEDSTFLNEYILSTLTSGYTIEQVEKLKGGVAQQNLSLGQVKSFQIPLPPLTQQKQIVAILDKAFAAIDIAKANAQQNLQNAKELFESYLQNIFENKGDDWEKKTFKELSSRIGDGLHGTPKYDVNGDYYFINGNNLNDGVIEIKENTKKISKEEFIKHKRELTNNTVLISINGTLGKVAFYDDEPVILGKSACYINFNDEVNKHYIKYLVKSPLFFRNMASNSTGATIKNFSLKSMRNYSLPFPSIEAQKQIVNKIDNISAETKKLEAIYTQKIADLEEMKKSVLQKAFSGQLNTIN